VGSIEADELRAKMNDNGLYHDGISMIHCLGKNGYGCEREARLAHRVLPSERDEGRTATGDQACTLNRSNHLDDAKSCCWTNEGYTKLQFVHSR
jgi:hypothetical protein